MAETYDGAAPLFPKKFMMDFIYSQQIAGSEKSDGGKMNHFIVDGRYKELPKRKDGQSMELC